MATRSDGKNSWPRSPRIMTASEPHSRFPLRPCNFGTLFDHGPGRGIEPDRSKCRQSRNEKQSSNQTNSEEEGAELPKATTRKWRCVWHLFRSYLHGTRSAITNLVSSLLFEARPKAQLTRSGGLYSPRLFVRELVEPAPCSRHGRFPRPTVDRSRQPRLWGLHDR